MATVLERVQAGASFLDEKWGSPAWREQINVHELDMGDSGECVLGKLYGDYHRACRMFGLFGLDRRAGLGFSIHDADFYEEKEAYRKWDELERTWIAYLKGETQNGNIPW